MNVFQSKQLSLLHFTLIVFNIIRSSGPIYVQYINSDEVMNIGIILTLVLSKFCLTHRAVTRSLVKQSADKVFKEDTKDDSIEHENSCRIL